MSTQKLHFVWLLTRGLAVVAAAASLLLLSACSISIGTPQQSTLTVAQVLQNSEQAMQKLKSFRFTFTADGSIEGSNAAASPTSATPTAAATSSAGNGGGIRFSLSGSGQQATASGEQALDLTINQSTHLAEVAIGQQLYVRSPRGQWYVIDTTRLAQTVSNPLIGLKLDANTLLALVLHSQISDHGDETLNGQSMRHISASLDRDGLRQLLESNTQLSNYLGSQNLTAILNHTRSLQADLDLWIDETHFYLQRVQFTLNLTAESGGLQTPVPLPATLTAVLHSRCDLSQFDGPVTISAPANATPIDNPAVIFQAA